MNVADARKITVAEIVEQKIEHDMVMSEIIDLAYRQLTADINTLDAQDLQDEWEDVVGGANL